MRYSDNYLQSLDRIKLNQEDINKLYSKNILITGASGLVCSALIDMFIWMNRKYMLNMNICAAGRNKERINRRFSIWKENYDYYFFQYDALLPLSDGIVADYIIHGASNANPMAYFFEPVETMLANFDGIKNLLEIMRKKETGRLLYISSSEVYGNKESSEPYSEENYGYVDILNPRACYPTSKRAAETLCAAYKKEYGIDFVIVRPGHIYGPTMTESDNRAASLFFRNAKQGKDIVMKSAGKQLRSYCYVIDCANAILTVLLKGVSGEAYNISNSNSVITIRDLAECVAKIGGVKLIFENPTDQEIASYNMMDNSSLNSKKIECLGWKGEYDIEAGVKETMESL